MTEGSLSQVQEQALNALLTAFLNQGSVIEIEFYKRDGSLRKMRCRLEHFSGLRQPGESRRYDFSKGRNVLCQEFGEGRRSFCIDRLVSIRHRGREVQFRDAAIVA